MFRRTSGRVQKRSVPSLIVTLIMSCGRVKRKSAQQDSSSCRGEESQLARAWQLHLCRERQGDLPQFFRDRQTFLFSILTWAVRLNMLS